MTKLLKKVFPALLLAAFCLPVLAQTEEGAEGAPDGAAAQGTESPKPARPAKKKPRAKKNDQLPLDDINPADTGATARKAPVKKAAKKKKKKKAKPVSEYKFSAVEKVPTYKFDKKANPIVKTSKKKAAKKGGRAKKTGTPAPKLKPSKSIGEEEKPAEPPQGAGDGQ